MTIHRMSQKRPELAGYPVTCVCGRLISSRMNQYLDIKETKGSAAAFKEMEVNIPCCQMTMMTTVNTIPAMLFASAAVRYKPAAKPEQKVE